MPAEVEGASVGPGLPGPMLSLTKHRSCGAVDGAGVGGVPGKAIDSPCWKALINVTVVDGLGPKTFLRRSSQLVAIEARLAPSLECVAPSPQAPTSAADAARSVA